MRDEPVGAPARRELALYVAAAVVAAVAVYRARGFYEDDAYITLRYAQRWIAGKGPCWTDGERVEGFTHPLWLVQLAALGRLGVGLVGASKALGVAYLAALFPLWWRARAWAVPLFVVATLPGLSLWAMGGLETASFAFWLTLGAWLTAATAGALPAGPEGSWRWGVAAGAALAAAALTRPEGLGVGLVAAGWIALARRPRPVAAFAAGFGAPLMAWQVVRLGYYGDWIANSARAKIGGAPLAMQLASGSHYLRGTAPLWAFGVVAAGVALVLARRAAALGMVAMAAPVVAGLLLGGGDHMLGARLVVPAVALLAFAAGVYGAPAAALQRRVAAAILAGAAMVQGWQAVAQEQRADAAAVVGAVVGRFLEGHLPAGALVATATAGSTAFFAPSLRFIDTLGLNDRHIAGRRIDVWLTQRQQLPGHRKGDGPYVLARAPDVIVLGPAHGYLGKNPRQWFLTDLELLEDPGFRAGYRPYRFVVPEGALTAYLREGAPASEVLAGRGERLAAPWE